MSDITSPNWSLDVGGVGADVQPCRAGVPATSRDDQGQRDSARCATAFNDAGRGQLGGRRSQQDTVSCSGALAGSPN